MHLPRGILVLAFFNGMDSELHFLKILSHSLTSQINQIVEYIDGFFF